VIDVHVQAFLYSTEAGSSASGGEAAVVQLVNGTVVESVSCSAHCTLEAEVLMFQAYILDQNTAKTLACGASVIE
jgi:hypothetical protein